MTALRSNPLSGFGRAALGAGFALAIAVTAASAQAWPDGNRDDFDPVTGYRCLTSCDVLIPAETNKCICTKDNPAETRLSHLKLTCSAKIDGQWVSCPVKTRYGN